MEFEYFIGIVYYNFVCVLLLKGEVDLVFVVLVSVVEGGFINLIYFCEDFDFELICDDKWFVEMILRIEV